MLRVTGTLSIVMVMNLRRFVSHGQDVLWRAAGAPTSVGVKLRDPVGASMPSETYFDQVRGTPDYVAALRQLPKPSGSFVEDQDERAVEDQGHALGVFRRRLQETHFFPTYELKEKGQALRSNNVQPDDPLAHHLDTWAFKVRLTRNGLVLVRLERDLDNVPLQAVSRWLLDLQEEVPGGGTSDDLLPALWRRAMDVVGAFADASDRHLPIPTMLGGKAGYATIPLTSDHNDTEKHPFHDRYITYQFRRITCEGQEISAEELCAAYPDQVLSLFENVLMSGADGWHYPAYNPEHARALARVNLASWRNELCLIGSEATLLYCPTSNLQPAYLSGSGQHQTGDAYDNYWRAIRRGIEHVVVLKNEVQLLERDTSSLLAEVPEITRSIAGAGGKIDRETRARISRLASGLAHLFYALPYHRDALVPSSAFRASYAIHKFERLIHVLGIKQIDAHIQTNVQELTSFLTHFDDVQLQRDASHTGTIVSLLTAALSLLAFPQFLAALEQIDWLGDRDLVTWPPTVWIWITIFATLLGMAAFFLLLRRWLTRR